MAKAPTDIRSLARAHTETAIKTLAGIMAQKSAPESARVAAAQYLIDRGWGKAPQVIDQTIHDGNKPADQRPDLSNLRHNSVTNIPSGGAEDASIH